MAEYRPELLPRRGEAIAWGCVLMVLAGGVVLWARGLPVPGAMVFLGVALLLAALGISLGNWMDRRTLLRLEPGGVHFENGLRNVTLSWEQIRQVQVYPSGWGRRVSVIGTQAHFEFRTLGEVRVQDAVKGRMGFVDGEMVLQRIIQSCGLVEARHSESSRAQVVYYARE